jgi:hypothetical protein
MGRLRPQTQRKQLVRFLPTRAATSIDLRRPLSEVKIGELIVGGEIRSRAILVQRKTGKPVQLS